MRRVLLAFLSVSLLSGFTLTWENPNNSDLSTIRIYQSTQPGTYGPHIAEIPAGAPGATKSYTGVNPERGTYYWVVKACDTSGNCSVPSNEVTLTFLDVTPPDAPKNLRVTE